VTKIRREQFIRLLPRRNKERDDLKKDKEGLSVPHRKEKKRTRNSRIREKEEKKEGAYTRKGEGLQVVNKLINRKGLCKKPERKGPKLESQGKSSSAEKEEKRRKRTPKDSQKPCLEIKRGSSNSTPHLKPWNRAGRLRDNSLRGSGTSPHRPVTELEA